MIDWSKILDWFKQTANVYWGLVIYGFTYLFLPSQLRLAMSLDQPTAPKFWAGQALVFGSSMLLASELVNLWPIVKAKVLGKAVHKALLGKLQKLTPPERGVLKYFIDKKSRALDLNPFDSAVVSLKKLGILTSGRPFQSWVGTLANFHLDQAVWEEIQREPGQLKEHVPYEPPSLC